MANWSYWEREIRSFMETGSASGNLGGTNAWRVVTNYLRESLREIERLRATPPTTSLVGGAAAGQLAKLAERHDEMVRIPASRRLANDTDELLALQGLVAKFSMQWRGALPAIQEALAAAASQPQQPLQPLGGPPKTIEVLRQAAMLLNAHLADSSAGNAPDHLPILNWLNDYEDLFPREDPGFEMSEHAIQHWFGKDALAAATPTTIEGSGPGELTKIAKRHSAWVNGVRNEATAELALESYEADVPALLAIVAPKAEWISVDERLPEFGVRVLFLYGCELGKKRITAGSFAQAGINDAHACPDNVWVNNYQPTHWQPLPTAPTPSEKAQ